MEIGDVSQGLARLWAGSEEGSREHIVRACQGILVVWGLPSGEQARVQVIEEMTRERPVRLVMLERAAAAAHIRATISAVCHLRGSHQKVCCEKISLPLSPGSESLSVSAVRSLLRGDIPITVWCPEEPPTDLAAFNELCDDADQLLVDTGSFAQPFQGLQWLSRCLERDSVLHPLDWSWERLAPWRRALSHRFEPCDVRERISGVQEVRVEVHGREATSQPVSALLLAGWITAALGRSDLKVTITRRNGSHRGENDPKSVAFGFQTGSPLEVTLPQEEELGVTLASSLARLIGHRSGDPEFEKALSAAVSLGETL